MKSNAENFGVYDRQDSRLHWDVAGQHKIRPRYCYLLKNHIVHFHAKFNEFWSGTQRRDMETGIGTGTRTDSCSAA